MAVMTNHCGLILVDMQNDFLKGGSLEVPRTKEIIPTINDLLSKSFEVRVATQDWHPQDHCSFASRWHKQPGESVMLENAVIQELWPDHCIQGTYGAAFSSFLDLSSIDFIVHKGSSVDVDSYSTFFDNQHVRSTGLEGYLRRNGIKTIFFAGVSTEYCVFYSVMDAIRLGFIAYVITDACRGVELHYGDIQAAYDAMQKNGAFLIHAEDVEKKLLELSETQYV